jgi:hypothetical protein
VSLAKEPGQDGLTIEKQARRHNQTEAGPKGSERGFLAMWKGTGSAAFPREEKVI